MCWLFGVESAGTLVCCYIVTVNTREALGGLPPGTYVIHTSSFNATCRLFGVPDDHIYYIYTYIFLVSDKTGGYTTLQFPHKVCNMHNY